MQVEVSKFQDFRAYLRAVAESRRQGRKAFSLATWARRLSLKSSSTLIMILNGTRNPSSVLMEKMIQEIGLSGKDAEFFRSLVLLEKAKSNPHLRALLTQHVPKTLRSNLPLMQMRYFRTMSHWYFMAIRELVNLPNFREDPAWIQGKLRFPVSASKIKEVLDVLVGCELLVRDKEGRLCYPSSVTTTFDVPNEDIRLYHKNSLDLCKEAVDQVPPQEREIISAAVSCQAKDMPFIKQRLRDVINDLETVAKGPADSIFLVQISCIPLTKNSQNPEKIQ